jgi:hypothetical protein
MIYRRVETVTLSEYRTVISPPALLWHANRCIIQIIIDKHTSSCGRFAFSSPSATQGLFFKDSYQDIHESCRY